MAIGQACVDRVARYVGERRQFGRPIVEFQMVQQLADMIVHVEAAIAPSTTWSATTATRSAGHSPAARPPCSASASCPST